MQINSYTVVNNVQEALEQINSKEYKIVAAGTDIIPQMRAQKHQGVDILDIYQLSKELGNIEICGDYLCIGALCTHEMILTHRDIVYYCRPLAEACKKIGSSQIRKRATIGGNIMNASPAADSIPVLVACDVIMVLQSVYGVREIPISEFFVSPGRTVCNKNEMLIQIKIPIYGYPWKGEYIKIGSRNALLISVVDAAILTHVKSGVRIACGSVGPTVRRSLATEKIFEKQNMNKSDFRQSIVNDINPISDVRASDEYRRNVLINVIYQAYLEKEGELK